MGMAAFLLQDQGGGLQPVSHWARKLNLATLLCVRFIRFGRMKSNQALEMLP
jgi:hypothetical protein